MGAELGVELPDGAFAENLTTSGLDVDAGRVGDRWAVGGEVVLRSGPRTPCGDRGRPFRRLACGSSRAEPCAPVTRWS